MLDVSALLVATPFPYAQCGSAPRTRKHEQMHMQQAATRSGNAHPLHERRF